MTKSKPTSPTSKKSSSQAKPVKDLDLDESKSGNVRGGNGGGGGGNSGLPGGASLPGKVSDAALKRDISTFGDALARLRLI